MTHICVSKLSIIGSDNGLSHDRRQAIIWTNAGLLLIGPLGTNFSEILIAILTFSFKKMCLILSSAKWRPFCLGLNVLTWDPYTGKTTSWYRDDPQVPWTLHSQYDGSSWLGDARSRDITRHDFNLAYGNISVSARGAFYNTPALFVKYGILRSILSSGI